MQRVNKSPCFHCQDRGPTCHDTCEKYLEYRAFVDHVNATRQKSGKCLSDVQAILSKNSGRKERQV